MFCPFCFLDIISYIRLDFALLLLGNFFFVTDVGLCSRRTPARRVGGLGNEQGTYAPLLAL